MSSVCIIDIRDQVKLSAKTPDTEISVRYLLCYFEDGSHPRSRLALCIIKRPSALCTQKGPTMMHTHTILTKTS